MPWISQDWNRDRNCALATNLNRPNAKTTSDIGSDSRHLLLPQWVHPDCWLSEWFSFHNIAHHRSSLVCALRRETRVGSIQPPAPAPRAGILSGRVSKLSARWMVMNMPKATGGQKTPRLTRGFPMWAFLTINPRAGRNARPYPRKFLSARCKTKPTCRPRPIHAAAEPWYPGDQRERN